VDLAPCGPRHIPLDVTTVQILWVLGGALVAAWCAGVQSPALMREETSRALPPRDEFLQRVRERLRDDSSILRDYTYQRTIIERDRDGSGQLVATRSRVYDVRPLPGDPDGYRVLLSRDGVPADAAEIRRAQAEYARRVAAARRPESSAARARRLADEAEDEREQRENVEDLVRLYEVTLVRREVRNGIPSVLLTFTPRPGVEPRTRAGRYLRSVSGRAWFSEAECELVHLDATVTEAINYGWGVLGRIDRGASASVDRQRTADGRWLPARYDFAGRGRVLLIKAVQRDATVTFSNYRPADATR
jgi:hypothetical protein